MTLEEGIQMMSTSESVKDWNEKRVLVFDKLLKSGIEMKHAIKAIDGVDDIELSSLIVRTLGKDVVE